MVTVKAGPWTGHAGTRKCFLQLIGLWVQEFHDRGSKSGCITDW